VLRIFTLFSKISVPIAVVIIKPHFPSSVFALTIATTVNVEAFECTRCRAKTDVITDATSVWVRRITSKC